MRGRGVCKPIHACPARRIAGTAGKGGQVRRHIGKQTLALRCWCADNQVPRHMCLPILVRQNDMVLFTANVSNLDSLMHIKPALHIGREVTHCGCATQRITTGHTPGGHGTVTGSSCAQHYKIR